MRRLAVGLISAIVPASACARTTDPDTLTIAVIPKGTSHAFWQSIHAGAEKAAQELKVTVIWRGPLREDERSAQIAEVEGFVTRGVSGIALAPLDDTALAPPVSEAVRRKIPVVIFDSALKGSGHVSFVATDNHQGGRLAGEGLAGMLPKGGKVVLLRYAEGSASTTEREAGFLEAIGERPDLQGRQRQSVRRRRYRSGLQEERGDPQHVQDAATADSMSPASSVRTSRRRWRCCVSSRTTAGPAR